MSIRSAASPDAALLHDLASATFALACPPGTLRTSIDDFIGRHLSVESFRSYLADPARLLLIAEGDDIPVGYTMLVFPDPMGADPIDPDVAFSVKLRPTAELSKVYVLNSQHGNGLASALLEASVGAVCRRGFSSVWLGVNQHNARANRFYEKNGFRIVGTKKFLVGPKWEDDFVRERVL